MSVASLRAVSFLEQPLPLSSPVATKIKIMELVRRSSNQVMEENQLFLIINVSFHGQQFARPPKKNKNFFMGE